MDLCGPLPVSNSGNKYVILFICRRSGAVKAIPIRNKETTTTADILLRHLIYTTGPPKILTHDRGSEMKGKFAETEKEYGIRIIKSSAYHPEGNGKAEAGIKKLKQKLLMFLENNCNIDGDWDQLPLIKTVHAINTTVSTLHGVTPMEVVIGRPVNEKSRLLAPKNSGEACDFIQSDVAIQNMEDKIGRKQLSTAVHAVIIRGQKRQIRSYRKK